MKLAAFLRRRIAWSIAIYRQSELSLPPQGKPDFIFRTDRALRLPGSPHTRADPFVFSHENDLYLFYETQVADDFGRIACTKITGDKIQYLGTILSEPFHLSYPSVIRDRDQIYLPPESQDANELRLYRFDRFPDTPVLVRTLLTGRYADPSTIFIDGMWYIFATTSRGLEIFFTTDLLHGEIRRHPQNPITKDLRYERCGGLPFTYHGRLVRPAQNCEGRYGKNLSLLEICQISPDAYREEPLQLDIFPNDQVWNAGGVHHVSSCSDGGGFAVAVDGQTPDHLHHKFLIRAWMLVTRRKRR